MAVEGGLAGVVPIVHTLAEAVFELLAVGALSSAGPVAVSERLKLTLPNFVKIIAIDIALPEYLSINIRAGADSAIYKNWAYVYSGAAEMRSWAHLLLIGGKVPLTAECNLHRLSL